MTHFVQQIVPRKHKQRVSGAGELSREGRTRGSDERLPPGERTPAVVSFLVVMCVASRY